MLGTPTAVQTILSTAGSAMLTLTTIVLTVMTLGVQLAMQQFSPRIVRALLDDPAKAFKRGAFTVVRRGKLMGRTVRTDRWRYTEWDGGERGAELYDEAADPGEWKNLAKDPAREGTVAELKKLLADGWKAAGPR